MERDTELVELPKGWVWTRLEDVCLDPQYGWTTSAAEKGLLHLLRTTDITSGVIDWDSVPFCRIEPPEKQKYLLKDGDIVISRAGSVGYSYLIKTPRESIFASYLIRFRPLTDELYLAYFLKSPAYWESISEKSLGIAIPNVNASKLRTVNVPLPPLPEQYRIVAKIEELVTRLDAGVEALKKIQLQLKRYRQSVLKSAFEGRLTAEWREAHQGEMEPASVLLEKIQAGRKKNGKYKELLPLDTSDLPELPEGWAWTRVGEITEVNPKLEYELANNTEVSFLPMRSVEAMTGKISLSIIKPYEEIRKGFTHFQNGDLLFAKITPCMENGKVAIVNNLHNGIGFGSTEFHVIRPFGQISSKALFFYVLQESFRKDAQREMTGTAGQLRVPAKYLSEVPFPLSPVSEQEQIVEEIERCFSVANEIEITIEHSLKQAERLRQSILKRAFEGQLVPQDPSDEPAEKLLERIRAEKAKNQTNTKRRRAVNAK